MFFLIDFRAIMLCSRHVHDIMLAGHGVQDKMEVQLTKNISILSLPCRIRTVDALATLGEGSAEAAGNVSDWAPGRIGNYQIVDEVVITLLLTCPALVTLDIHLQLFGYGQRSDCISSVDPVVSTAKYSGWAQKKLILVLEIRRDGHFSWDLFSFLC